MPFHDREFWSGVDGDATRALEQHSGCDDATWFVLAGCPQRCDHQIRIACTELDV